MVLVLWELVLETNLLTQDLPFLGTSEENKYCLMFVCQQYKHCSMFLPKLREFFAVFDLYNLWIHANFFQYHFDLLVSSLNFCTRRILYSAYSGMPWDLKRFVLLQSSFPLFSFILSSYFTKIEQARCCNLFCFFRGNLDGFVYRL